MNKNKMCEALYALQGNRIVKHRKPLGIPLLLLFVGAVLLVANAVLLNDEQSDLKSAFVFVGGLSAVIGACLTLSRLCGNGGVPYHKESKNRLYYEELFFDRSKRGEVMEMIAAGNIDGLLGLERQSVPALAVMVYRTRDNSCAACQVFEYSDLEYRQLCDIKIIDK